MALQEQSSKTASIPSSSHLQYLDGLRAVAALYVVLHHLNYYLPPRPEASTVPSIFKVILLLTAFGHYAVTVFIVISGFCLMLPFVRYGELRGGNLHFFKKRFHRILPPYYLSVLVSLVLIKFVIGDPDAASLWNLSLPVLFRDVVLHIFLVHDIFVGTASKINYILWSVAVEWRIYFLFPLFLILWRRINIFVLTFIITALSLAAQMLLASTPLNSTPTGICLHYIGLFVLGMLGCQISFSKDSRFSFRDGILWGWAAFVVFVVVVLAIFKSNLPFFLNDIVVACWTTLLLIHLSLVQKGIVFSILSQKFTAFLGTFAYSIYLTHPMTLQLWRKYVILSNHMEYNTSFIYSYTVGMLVVVGAAYLFFIGCERPFLNSRKSQRPHTTLVEGVG